MIQCFSEYVKDANRFRNGASRSDLPASRFAIEVKSA